MKHFTIHKNFAIDKKILLDLSIIRNKLLEEFRNEFIAILLTGGFGRGEGGVLIKNKEIKIVNDYDLHLITRRKLDSHRLKKMCVTLAKTLKIDHIDMIAQPLYSLILNMNTQYGYDLKHGSYVVYGNRKIIRKLPSTYYFPPRELEKLLFTRIWCFLGGIKERHFFRKGLSNPTERFLLFEQLSKAVLAVEDSWLMSVNDYCVSYLRKLERIKKYVRDKKMLKWFEWATLFKVRPTDALELDPIDSYFEVKNMFLKEMLTLLNKAYKTKFISWYEYVNHFFKRVDIIIEIILKSLINRNYHNAFLNKKVRLAQILLVDACKRIQTEEIIFEPQKIKFVLNLFRDDVKFNDLLKYNISYSEMWWRLRDFLLKLQNMCSNGDNIK